MGGMLPGVEAARRRRINHGGCGGSTHPSLGLLSPSSLSSRRSSFSLFSSSSLQQRSRTDPTDDKLGQSAREAKQRLHQRLTAVTKSPIQRKDSDVSQERMNREMTTEVYGTKIRKQQQQNSRWKTWEQQECAVCLEEFKVGDNLVSLPCAHTFHSRCLVPWLHTTPHCPCCRISIFC